MRIASLFGLSAFVASALGCNFVVGTGDYAFVDAGGTGAQDTGAKIDPRLACGADFAKAPAPPNPNVQHTYKLTVVEPGGAGVVLPGINVKLCSNGGCTGTIPLTGDVSTDMGLPWVKTPSDGVITAKVSEGFVGGYFEFAASGEHRLTRRIITNPVIADVGVDVALQQAIQTNFVVDQIGSALKVPVDLTNKSLIVMRVLDCAGSPFVGATVNISAAAGSSIEGVTGYYQSADKFFVLATDPTSQIDSKGAAGFVNVAPGTYTFSATQPDGKPIGSVDVIVKAGVVYTVPVRIAAQ